jgi:hypothetical protein
MPKEFSEASDVEKMAGGLIPNYHPELAEARILFVFVDKAGMKNGRELHGKAQKVSGLWEWALEKDFVIQIALDKWNTLEELQRTALVDHMLECCTGEEDEDSGETKWKIRDPEVQEFATILQRYGAWHQGLESFISIAKQINLDALIEEEAEIDLSQEEQEQVQDQDV